MYPLDSAQSGQHQYLSYVDEDDVIVAYAASDEFDDDDTIGC